jgi:Cytochrome c554 and c-prime
MGVRRNVSIFPSIKTGPWFAVAALYATACLGALAQTNSLGGISLPTALRVQNPGWWPTKGTPSRDDYVGTAECAKCHSAEAASYQRTAMFQAGVPATDLESLHQLDRLTFHLGPYSYRIETVNENKVLSVSDGKSELLQVFLWALGVGHMGQTYVYEQDGSFYESHLSFYSEPRQLDITPGQLRSIPSGLEDAAGRRMTTGEARLCFGCHTTASTSNDQFDPSGAFPGVTCEACHGPGAKHVAAMKSGRFAEGLKAVLNPGRMNAVDSVDFCGACHRTWEDVVKSGSIGIGVYNVRFAPYRLENSRCWGGGDVRLTCIACHNPHQPLGSEPGAYDSRCLKCHAERGMKKTRDRPGAACPVGRKNCAGCHMPKYSPPDLHSRFTDHWIRVVKQGKPYPS